MTGITIVTGSPGAGKTTLSRHAAQGDPRGLHIPADVFYTFPAHPVAPVLPEAHEQNGAVIAAVSRAAAAFASRGYEVFLDGIIGPWFLPVVAAELGSSGIPVAYVVLQVSLEQAVRRATSRTQPGAETVVRLGRRSCAGPRTSADANLPDITMNPTAASLRSATENYRARWAAGLRRQRGEAWQAISSSSWQQQCWACSSARSWPKARS